MIDQQPTTIDVQPLTTTVVSLTDAAAASSRELTKEETNPDDRPARLRLLRRLLRLPLRDDARGRPDARGQASSTSAASRSTSTARASTSCRARRSTTSTPSWAPASRSTTRTRWRPAAAAPASGPPTTAARPRAARTDPPTRAVNDGRVAPHDRKPPGDRRLRRSRRRPAAHGARPLVTADRYAGAMGGRGHATEPVVGQPSFQDRRRHVMPMTRATHLRVTLPMAYLAVGALLVVVHATLETGSLPQSLLYDVIGASAVTVALIGVWRNKPDRAAPWILMAIGQAPVRGRRPALELVRGHRRGPVPVHGRRAVPRRLPVHRARAPDDDPPARRRRRPWRPARCGHPDDGRGDPVLDLPDAAAAGRRRSSTSTSLPDHPRLPGRRPAPHRRRDGPPDDARRPHAVLPDARR